MKRVALRFTVLLFLLGTAIAQDELATLKFLVIRDYNGKPVRNASVILHPVGKNGKQLRNGLQLKSDAEGKTSYDGVPYGKLRIQVLATGFQTFGEDYDIDSPEKEITIRMKRPTEQYSIYTDKNNDKKEDAPAAEKKDENTQAEKQSKDKPQ